MTKMGMKRDDDAKPYKFKRSRLRKVSKKQAKRNRVLRSKLEVVLGVQHEIYGTTRCEAGFKGWKDGCFGDLVLDHVQTRQAQNPDGYENLQVLCVAHNGLKGSKRGLDFRPQEMIDKMRELQINETGDADA